MASKQTTHYQLSQWEATDAVVRRDFNDDNAKIDAALYALEKGKADKAEITVLSNTVTQNAEKESVDISALRSENYWVKLSDVTLSQDAADYTWELPEHADYAQLLCQFTLQGAGDITAKINGGVKLYKPNDSAVMTGFTLTYESMKGAGGQFRIYPIGFVPNAAIFYEAVNIRADGACSNLSDYTATKAVAYPQVNQINLVPKTGSILAGSRFIVYGLKK